MSVVADQYWDRCGSLFRCGVDLIPMKELWPAFGVDEEGVFSSKVMGLHDSCTVGD